MTIAKICNKTIEYSYYALFLLVPLVFTSDSFELFEFNKMWLTFALTIIIFAAWATKSIVKKEIRVQRTPLDIPILLFLASHIISTIFSLDTHVSIWGYYSRWNGGLLSIISYIFLYYAFVSNFEFKSTEARGDGERGALRGGPALVSAVGNAWGCEPAGPQAIIMVIRLLKISLISGLIVALWGLPSHFGYDPTCLIFRGSFDVSCWTADFQPKVRIFSTLGQPDWLAACLAILIPISIAFAITNLKSKITSSKQVQNTKYKIQNDSSFNYLNFENWNLFGIWNFKFGIFLILSALFYLALLYTGARSGFLAIWAALIFFFVAYLWPQRKQLTQISPRKILLKYWYLLVVLVFIGSITFVVGTPFSQASKFTLPGLFSKPQKAVPLKVAPAALNAGGGTSSVEIRAIVWRGAIDVFGHYPIFGTGVETFAFAYYKYRPIEHNLVSEWDFLYNKAHNEYLNFLATTGVVGLGTYLLMIGAFLFLAFKYSNHKSQITNHKQIQDYNNQNSKHFENLDFENWNLFGIWNFKFGILSLALLASYISILVSNFFGFSVVIVNLYLFLIPAFVFVLNGTIDPQKIFVFPNNELRIRNSCPEKSRRDELKISVGQRIVIIVLLLVICYMLFNLLRFWQADKDYALGYNLDKVGEYQQGYPKLLEAVNKRGNEPVFKDELSINEAVLAAALFNQQEKQPDQEKAASQAATALMEESIAISNQLKSDYPNNVVFAKTRVRVFYTLSQTDPKYLQEALNSIIRASKLAPTDAKVSYNLGLLYGQTGDTKKAIETLENTVRLKPDYRDAFYALGLFYHEAAIDKSGRVINLELQKKAVETMNHLVKSFNDDTAKSALKSWGE